VVSQRKPFELQAPGNNVSHVIWPRRTFSSVVTRDCPAQRDTSMIIHNIEGCFEMIPTNVVKVDIDTIWRRHGQLLPDSGFLVIKSFVIAVLFSKQSYLFWRTCRPNSPARA